MNIQPVVFSLSALSQTLIKRLLIKRLREAASIVANPADVSQALKKDTLASGTQRNKLKNIVLFIHWIRGELDQLK